MATRRKRAKKLTRGTEDYLETIHLLGQSQDVVRVRDIALALGVSMPSVTGMVSRLKQQGLVTHRRYESVNLTKQGQERAQQVYRCHEGIREFLETVLGLGSREAEKQACRMEHAVSEQTLTRLTKLIEYIGFSRKSREQWVQELCEYLNTGKLPARASSE